MKTRRIVRKEKCVGKLYPNTKQERRLLASDPGGSMLSLMQRVKSLDSEPLPHDHFLNDLNL